MPANSCTPCSGTYEVAAAAVLLRSTPFSNCFLEDWYRKGTELNENADNGE